MSLQNHTIPILGLRYIGLPLVTEFGKKCPVVSFDINVDQIAMVPAEYARSCKKRSVMLCWR